MSSEKTADVLAEMIKESLREVLLETGWAVKAARPGLITMEAAAEYASCSITFIRNLVTAGILTTVRWPNQGKRQKPYIALEDLEKAINDHKHRDGRHAS